MKSKAVPLVVTTLHKGVFFGYGEPTDKTEIRLERAQMAVKWTSDIGGVMGLAGEGPSKSCKISRPIPAITLRDVTAVMEASPEAAKGWEKCPWG